MEPTDSPTSSVVPEGVTIATVGDLIGLWPSLSDFAADLAVPYDTAKGMRRRGKIAPNYWTTLVEAAARRDIAGPSFELLSRLHARQPANAEASP
jgi:hypothetical protein